MLKTRLDHLDILKGILIVSVVIGHSKFPYLSYIFWFHMPAFFMVSGFLYRHYKKNNQNLVPYYAHKASQYLLPYISYFILITVLIYSFRLGTFNINDLILRTKNFLWGGTYLINEYGIFWFITTMYFTKLSFSVIYKIEMRETFKIALIISLYVGGFLLNNNKLETYQITNGWWHIRFVLISLVYYMFGYYYRSLVKLINARVLFILCTSFLLLLTYLHASTNFHYLLNIKYGYHNNLILDFMVPAASFVLLYQISQYINRRYFNVLKIIGTYTLPIMYLHILINKIALIYFPENWLIYSMIGLTVPVVFSMLCKKYILTRRLFVGN